jgi:lipooligosaccharide transport system permease protein
VNPPDWLWGIWCVWLRYFTVFTKSWRYYLVTTFLEPLLYLASFGFGVAGLIGRLQTEGTSLSYRSFIFSGIIAQAILFQSFFEGSYGGFVRMYYQKIFQAIAITPITLSEVLWGELIWDATKATLAASVVWLIGAVSGTFAIGSLLLLLPLSFMAALLFAAMGLTAAAYARTIEELSYPQYLLVFPMFLFCGVFYPIDALPTWLQQIAWIFPLTSLNSLVRSLTLGLPFHPQALPILIAWLLVLVPLSRRAMTRRLVK